MTTPSPVRPENHNKIPAIDPVERTPSGDPRVLLESLIEALARQVVLDFHGSEAGSGVTGAHIVLALVTLLALAIHAF